MKFSPPFFPYFDAGLRNKNIKSFGLTGELADDKFIVGHKQKIEKMIDIQMRDSGYVPILDLETQYLLSYNADKNTYNFEFLTFGVYVGKRKAKKVVGISSNQFVYG